MDDPSLLQGNVHRWQAMTAAVLTELVPSLCLENGIEHLDRYVKELWISSICKVRC